VPLIWKTKWVDASVTESRGSSLVGGRLGRRCGKVAPGAVVTSLRPGRRKGSGSVDAAPCCRWEPKPPAFRYSLPSTTQVGGQARSPTVREAVACRDAISPR
jgi:hypothetical protein